MKRSGLMVIVACALLVALIGPALTQDAGGGPGGRRQRDRSQMQQRMERFRLERQKQFREQLGATEEEWKVLWPRIEKVQQLQGQARFGGRMGVVRGRRRRGSGDGDQTSTDQPQRQLSEVQKKTEALRKLIDSKTSDAATLQTAMAELRAARAKAQKELADAQKQLKELLTVRQEAVLVLRRVLD